VNTGPVAHSLIGPEQLAASLDRVSVLDVRWELGRSDGYEQFVHGHVPGASYVDLETDLADPPGARGRHPLPDPDRFAAAMRRSGVTRRRPVVVYDDVSGGSAARAWWLLRYHGHGDVRILDGGWKWWLHDGGPAETGAGSPRQGDFRADPGHLPVLDAGGALRVAAVGRLIDARAPGRFRGEVEPVDPVAGHVPGAVNVPSADNLVAAGTDRHGRFRPKAELADRYRLAGLAPGTEIGVYCGSGVTAAHDVFALDLLGVEAALYPGSWSEWVTDPDRPVATGAEGADGAATSARP
jgi:thiosulfate/3-mercaptopyruvate sulfurtransferase